MWQSNQKYGAVVCTGHMRAQRKPQLQGFNWQKGAGDPAEWLPPNKAYQIEYAQAWVAVKLKWGLTSDPKEIAVLRSLLGAEAEMPIMAEERSGSINPWRQQIKWFLRIMHRISE